jgi:hypothetical protein
MKRHLFVLYVWQEPVDEQQKEWRGRIVYVDSGEVYFFRDPATLYQVLLQMMPGEQREDKTK